MVRISAAERANLHDRLAKMGANIAAFAGAALAFMAASMNAFLLPPLIAPLILLIVHCGQDLDIV